MSKLQTEKSFYNIFGPHYRIFRKDDGNLTILNYIIKSLTVKNSTEIAYTNISKKTFNKYKKRDLLRWMFRIMPFFLLLISLVLFVNGNIFSGIALLIGCAIFVTFLVKCKKKIHEMLMTSTLEIVFQKLSNDELKTNYLTLGTFSPKAYDYNKVSDIEGFLAISQDISDMWNALENVKQKESDVDSDWDDNMSNLADATEFEWKLESEVSRMNDFLKIKES